MTSWDFSHFLPSTRWRREHIFQSVGLTTVPQQLGKAPIEARQKIAAASWINRLDPFGAWINRFHFFLLLATWSLRCGQCRCKFGLCEEKTSRMSNEIRAYKLPKWEIVILKACLLKSPHRPRVGRGLHENHELIRRTAQAATLSTSMKLCPIMASADRRPPWNTRSDLWTA